MTPNEAAAPTRIDRSLKTRRVKLSALVADEANKRTHDERNLAAIEESIRKHGVVEPLVVQKGTNRIVAGNGRAEALRRLGYSHVDVVDVEIATEEEFRALSIRLNRTGELAGWDGAGLEADLAMLAEAGWGNLPEFGFDEKALDALAGEHAVSPELIVQPIVLIADDQAPEVSNSTHSRVGDVYFLGQHRLLCGSCREPADVARLLDGRKINLAFTSPPYASQREYDPSSGFKPIPADEYVAWFDAVQAGVRKHLAPDGSWFVNIKPASEGLDTQTYVLDLVLAHARSWGWHFAAEFCWERTGIPGKPARRFKNQFEPVYQFALGEWKFRPEDVRHESRSAFSYEAGKGKSLVENQGIEGEEWFAGRAGDGLAYPGNRLPSFSGSHEAMGHAAAFPSGLPAFFIRAYADAGDIVYDPFLGSGTTLIAAAKHGRVAYGTEISPRYCDVIRRRWWLFANANGLDPGSGALPPE